MLEKFLVVYLSILMIWRIKSTLFRPPVNDPNYHHFKRHELQVSKFKARCDVSNIANSPSYFTLDNEIARSQVERCPHAYQGSKSEHAVLSLCSAIDYPLDCGFLPDNWIAVGEDMKTRCEKNISVDKTFPIATFTWVKMPNPSDNFYQFYDGGHSAIFLGCMKKGGIYVADQWCGSPFGVRQIEQDALFRYFEIGSHTKNPHKNKFGHDAQHILKRFIVGLAKGVEDTVQIAGHHNYFTRPIKNWHLTVETKCWPELSGPFLQEPLPYPQAVQYNFGNPICDESAPGNFIHQTGSFNQNRYLLNLTLRTDCRLNIELKYSQNNSLLIERQFEPGDEPDSDKFSFVCKNSICLQFEEFHFNDHGCYQGLIQFTADTEHSQKQMFSSVHFEVCPTTMDYAFHQLHHENPMQSDRGYSKSTNMDVERCSESSVPRKKLLHKEWVIGDASDSLVLDIFLFVGNRDCQLQLHIVDENEITTESYPGHDCVLCQNYVFPQKFNQHDCHISGTINSNGERMVICHCLKWVNEYTTKYGEKCFEGELVIQSNIQWSKFIMPKDHGIYPFDLCAQTKKYQPLPCKTSSNVDIHALVDFSFSRTNSRTYVDVSFVINTQCQLHISMQQNGIALKFMDEMIWGYDEKVPVEYNDLRCSIKSANDGSNNKERICFRFAESRFEKYCYRGIIILQKSIIDARNKTTPESAIPVPYELCAPPSPTGSFSLYEPYEEQCNELNETVVTQMVGWRNITGEGHEENIVINIARKKNCQLKLLAIWRKEHILLHLGDSNIKMEDKQREQKCFGQQFIVCIILRQLHGTNVGCIEGNLQLTVLEKHARDFSRVLTVNNIDFRACPIECSISSD